MSGFRPSIISTVALIAVGWGLCALGFWQVDRWYQMSAQKEQYDHEIARKPVTVKSLSELDAVSPWGKLELSGEYVGVQGRVINKYINGQLGVWLAAPFRLEDGTHIVVMRGWVPDDEKRWPPPKGPERAVGILRNGSGDLGAYLQGQDFRSLDGYATLGHFNLNRGVGRVLIAGQQVEDGAAFPVELPRRGFYGFKISRPHREYAGTWFGLAFALLAIWVYAGVRRARQEEQQ